jgi:hypothetical protein
MNGGESSDFNFPPSISPTIRQVVPMILPPMILPLPSFHIFLPPSFCLKSMLIGG